MFEYLKGILTFSSPDKAVLDVTGVGYLLHISIATFEKLPNLGETTQLYTSFIVREDSHRLYGFLSLEERNFFGTLTDISGIGPRIAISILGHMSLPDLHAAVQTADTKTIVKIPGIGKKMAERLVLELRDKTQIKESALSLPKKGAIEDAIRALVKLGYKAPDAQKAVATVIEVKGEETPLTELISLALKARHS